MTSEQDVEAVLRALQTLNVARCELARVVTNLKNQGATDVPTRQLEFAKVMAQRLGAAAEAEPPAPWQLVGRLEKLVSALRLAIHKKSDSEWVACHAADVANACEEIYRGAMTRR